MKKGEQSKARIIETAGELFWKNGYTKTGINEILKATGLPKGSFYFHFKSKAEVARAVVSYYSHTILDLLQSVADASDSWDVFCDSLLEAFQSDLQNRRYYGCPLAVVGTEIAFGEEDVLKDYCRAMERVKDIFAQVLEKSGVKEEQLLETADLCFTIYEGNLLLLRIEKEQGRLKQMNTQLKQVVKASSWNK